MTAILRCVLRSADWTVVVQEKDPAAPFGGTKSEYTRSQLESSAAAKEDFFARQMASNASKPEGVAPSQARLQFNFRPAWI